MKKIVAINASPRVGWNTWSMVDKAAKAAQEQGADIQFFNLYQLEKHGGCMSCFACKRKPNEGKCVFPDGLKEVLQAIREADGLIIGSPNYLGDVSSEFHALMERLHFQKLTYQTECRYYESGTIPVLFIMTSNAPIDYYKPLGYDDMIKRYQMALTESVGNTKVLIAGNTKQVKDYSLFNWTMFDAKNKQESHDKKFPKDLEKAFELGSQMVTKGW